MSDLSFSTLDVFTDVRFGGNPLAVVLGADALTTAQMQRLAREFNLSETVFPVAATADDCAMQLRIFTALEELPFAGHPIVGAACALAELGLVPPGSEVRLQFQTGVGAVPVSIRHALNRPPHAELTTVQAPHFGAHVDAREDLGAVVGLTPDDIGHDEGHGFETARVVSCGLPMLLVPLRSPECLAGIEVDFHALRALLQSCAAHSLYLYARGYEGELRCRMFSPGIGEDPATGSAAAALGARLAQDLIDRDETSPGPWQWTILQGLEMGRPSRIEVSAARGQAGVGAVTVGGYAVPVMSGSVHAL